MVVTEQQRHPRQASKKGAFKPIPLQHTNTHRPIQPAMTRLDRTRTSPHQLRPFFSSQNLLNRADGSAQFDFGELEGIVVFILLPVGAMTNAEPTRKERRQ